jgi:hypothetical protein
MIPGTSYSPAKAFITFARDFFEALAKEDFQAALGGLDISSKRWSKKELLASLSTVIGSEHICSASGLTQSASPELEQSESGYILRHRLPVQGKWVKAKAVFEFTQKPGTDYFRASLRGFEP